MVGWSVFDKKSITRTTDNDEAISIVFVVVAVVVVVVVVVVFYFLSLQKYFGTEALRLLLAYFLLKSQQRNYQSCLMYGNCSVN